MSARGSGRLGGLLWIGRVLGVVGIDGRIVADGAAGVASPSLRASTARSRARCRCSSSGAARSPARAASSATL